MAQRAGIGERPFIAAFMHPPTLFKRPGASYPPAREDPTMKLGLSIRYSGAHLEVPVARVQRAEELGYDSVWSAASIDAMSGGGRFIAGLGVSGPQIVEGWYGQRG
jgi:hypothetical protein